MNKLQVIHNAKTQTAEILIYGPIGGSSWSEDGITSKQFNDALKDIPSGTKITIGINSQGGAIGEGLAIYNAIKRRAADITARIDGYALSAGSFIPLAASKVISPESSIWMIHKGWSMAVGNADDMRKNADLLDKHDETLIGIYADKTGKDANEIEQALADEIWLTGKEAIEWGLADEEGGDSDTKAMDSIDLTQAPEGAFKRNPVVALINLHKRILAGLTGRQVRKPASAGSPDVTPATHFQPALAQAGSVKPQPKPASSGAGKDNVMNRDQIVALLKKHGETVDDIATDEQVQAQLEGLLANAKAQKTEDKNEVVEAIKALKEEIKALKLEPKEPAAAAPLAVFIENTEPKTTEEIVKAFNEMEPGQARSEFYQKHRNVLL